mmetsp:Transcript_107737/g.305337  ORF Transcript_107737/g.305337 Transcript_107737/m.305337 type:complete len:257 (-) Transcript_107737:216-986(-)
MLVLSEPDTEITPPRAASIAATTWGSRPWRSARKARSFGHTPNSITVEFPHGLLATSWAMSTSSLGASRTNCSTRLSMVWMPCGLAYFSTICRNCHTRLTMLPRRPAHESRAWPTVGEYASTSSCSPAAVAEALLASHDVHSRVSGAALAALLTTLAASQSWTTVAGRSPPSSSWKSRLVPAELSSLWARLARSPRCAADASRPRLWTRSRRVCDTTFSWKARDGVPRTSLSSRASDSPTRLPPSISATRGMRPVR